MKTGSGAAIIAAVAGVGGYLTYQSGQPSPATRSALTQPTNEAAATSTAPSSNASPTVRVTVPLVDGFYKGQEILFMHTEASDKKVADLLTGMMGSKVIFVPSLSNVPATALADVYVFTNGVRGGGPMGFQPDVFSSVPGDEDYTPLRTLNLVSWEENATSRELKSVKDVNLAAGKGELTVIRPGAVINMPTVKWPGGQR